MCALWSGSLRGITPVVISLVTSYIRNNKKIKAPLQKLNIIIYWKTVHNKAT